MPPNSTPEAGLCIRCNVNERDPSLTEVDAKGLCADCYSDNFRVRWGGGLAPVCCEEELKTEESDPQVA